MRIKLFFILLLFATFSVNAQVFEEDEKYAIEYIWGINKNTNGGLIGGFVFRYSRIKDKGLYETFGLELMNVKHPNETRYISGSGGRFIFGKTNYLYSVRFQYGRDKLLFKKASQKGVQINALLAGGPTLGVISPYYVLHGGKYEPFNIKTHVSPRNIASSGKIFQGLGESKLTIGFNAKAGLSFEFGTYKGAVTGMEIGVLIEGFSKKIELMPTLPNESLFGSFYFTLYRGRRK